MRIPIILLFAALVASCASQKSTPYVKHIDQSINMPSDATPALKVEKFKQAPFHGQVSYDDVGGAQGGMMYPGGGGAAGFAAAVLTHALVADAVEDAEKQDKQEKADEVLEPYTEVIHGFKAAGLVEASLGGLKKRGLPFDLWSQEGAGEWVVHATPVYFMSPDQSTLILKNAVSVVPAANPEQPAYQNLFEVVSSPRSGGGGPIEVESLRDLSVALFVDSLAALRAEVGGEAGQNGGEKTLRYYSGGEKVYERGRVIARTCDRMTFRSLRGWVKSVPIVDGGDTGDCPAD